MKQEENRQMDKLKSDYESIPVPTEAKERMLAGIAQAKKEQVRIGEGAIVTIGATTFILHVPGGEEE